MLALLRVHEWNTTPVDIVSATETSYARSKARRDIVFGNKRGFPEFGARRSVTRDKHRDRKCVSYIYGFAKVSKILAEDNLESNFIGL